MNPYVLVYRLIFLLREIARRRKGFKRKKEIKKFR